jgi:hypothetical protein
LLSLSILTHARTVLNQTFPAGSSITQHCRAVFFLAEKEPNINDAEGDVEMGL